MTEFHSNLIATIEPVLHRQEQERHVTWNVGNYVYFNGGRWKKNSCADNDEDKSSKNQIVQRASPLERWGATARVIDRFLSFLRVS